MILVMNYATLMGVLLSFSVCAQQYTTISGLVRDAEGGDPIPFVNIQLKGVGLGTASNANGEFALKIPASHTSDSLLFSSVGYHSQVVAIEKIKRPITISLNPAITELLPVTVTAESGLDILKKAIEKIPQNYDTSNFQMTAFYRENIWLEDFELSFNEAVLDIHKTFKVVKNTPNDQIRIIKGRKKQIDFRSDGQFYFWISGISNGARGILSDDLIKYHQSPANPLNARNFKYYNYTYNSTITDGNVNLIVLDVIPKPKAKKGLLNIKLYIEEASLAIVKYQFELSEAGVRYVSRKDNGLAYLIMSKVVKATRTYDKFQGTFSFRKYNNKWYMSNAQRHWEILINSRKRNIEDGVWRADMDFVVTGIDTVDARPILEGNIGENKSSFTSMIGNEYDEAFWENYNVLSPVVRDSLNPKSFAPLDNDSLPRRKPNTYGQHQVTRGDTLRGKLTALRTCYDVTFYHLDVAMDMEKRTISGSNRIRFRAEESFQKMQVDLYANMKIDSITYEGLHLPYTREFDAVFVNFPVEIRKGAENEVAIYYHGAPKTPDWSIPMNGGVLWDTDSLGNPWVQMVCQGSGASLWWPNKDHQSDEPDSMKIWVTIPNEFTEVSNGRLVRKTPLPKNLMRYEWYVSYPINNYNVTFNIGKYAHYNDQYISDDTLTIDYYVMEYNLEKSKAMFRQVKPMLKSFEKYYGKYPFKNDGFTLVESIYPMEHQSGVCIGKIIQQTSGDTNPLLWHESAHEWWGNAITCKDVADMWIHEAFATYAEYQVIEDRFGKDVAYHAILEQAEAVINEQPVIGIYDINHIFYDIGDMYSKGSLMLHTFRNVLNNDTVWNNLLRDIQHHFKYQTLSSDELIHFINQKTKADYNYLFDQYLKHVKLPLLEVTLREQGKNLVIKYRWVSDVENFRMPALVTTSLEHYDFIFPKTEWQTMILEDMEKHDFDVDDQRFFIHVMID